MAEKVKFQIATILKEEKNIAYVNLLATEESFINPLQSPSYLKIFGEATKLFKDAKEGDIFTLTISKQ